MKMKKYTLLKKFNAFNLKLLTRRRRDWSHKFARFKYMYKANAFLRWLNEREDFLRIKGQILMCWLLYFKGAYLFSIRI